MRTVFQLFAFSRQAAPRAGAHAGQHRAIGAFQRKLVLDVFVRKKMRYLPLGPMTSRHSSRGALRLRLTPWIRQRRRRASARQLDILQAKCFGTGDKVFADHAASAHDAKTYPELAMFEEEDAGFEFLIMANQNSSNSPISLGVCSDEILRVGREVVLLTATLSEFTNRRDKGP